MREILFRGKQVENGNMIIGDLQYVVNPDGSYYLHIADNCNGRNNRTGVRIIPETVGEFTGLTDKVGKQIFEGDRVCVESENSEGEFIKRIGIIEWYGSAFFVFLIIMYGARKSVNGVILTRLIMMILRLSATFTNPPPKF